MSVPVITLSLALLLHGQPTQPSIVTSAPAIALDEAYFDTSYGFSLRPPVGWQLDRERKVGPRATMLLRMIEPSTTVEPRTIVVEHLSVARPFSIEDRLKQSAAALSIEFKSPEIEQKLQEIAGRPGAYLSATFEVSERPMFRLYAIVEIAPRSFLTIRHEASADVRSQSEPMFRRVVDSLKLLSSPLSDDELRAAIDRGMEFLEGLDAANLKKAVVAEQYFLIVRDNRPIGCVEIYQHETSKSIRSLRHEGIETFEQSWIFDENGTARRSQNKSFLSFDRQLEKWQSSTTTWMPAAGDRTEHFDNAYQEGLRDNNVLISSQSPSYSIPLEQNPVIELPKSYIPRPLIRMLPRLVGSLEKERTLAFAGFDSARMGLIVRIVEFRGQAKSDGPDEPRGLFRIHEREGVSAEPSEIYVDAQGAIRLSRTRAFETRISTLAELKEHFNDRVTQAEDAMLRMEQHYQQSESRFIRRR